MIRIALPAAALMLAACTTQQQPATPASPGQCSAAPAQSLIGRTASDSLENAKALSGATTVRVYKKGAIITMDYRADRVNLVVDDANAIVEVTCG